MSADTLSIALECQNKTVGHKNKSIIIVGAGMGGLASGCYAQMNGYQSKIIEMHNMPGGCCTAWSVKDYLCDYCIGWMPGCGEDFSNDICNLWDELGAFENTKIKHFDVFNSVTCDDGTVVHIYVDPDRLEKHLLSISPQDKPLIKQFCKYLQRFVKFVEVYPLLVMKPPLLMNWGEKIRLFTKLLPFIPLFMRTMSIQMTDFANKFQSAAIRQAIQCIFYTRYEGLPLLPFLNNIAFSTVKVGGCPEYGSLGVAKSIADRYISLGGEIVYEQKVQKVLVENNEAVGVITDEKHYYADYVITAMDGYSAINHLLDGKYQNSTIKKVYYKAKHDPKGMVFQGVFTLIVGVKGEFLHLPHAMTHFFTEEEIKGMTGVTDVSFSVQVRSNMFARVAPPDRSLFYITCLSDCEAWEKLDESDAKTRSRGNHRARKHTTRKRSRAYIQAKKDTAQIMLKKFKALYPQVAENIEFVDASTPLTVVRYTGNLGGALLAWVPFAEDVEPLEKYFKKNGPVLPGLKNLYLAGQWVEGGGLITSAASGRHAIQHICRKDRKTFTVKDTNEISIQKSSEKFNKEIPNLLVNEN